MTKQTSRAFTLIEILIVLVVIGFMATIISPWLIRKEPSSEWRAVRSQLDDLIYFARQESISTRNIYRLVFDRGKNLIYVQQEEDNKEKPGHKIYKDAISDYFNTKYFLPDSIRMAAFYQGAKNRFYENKGVAYSYVIPNGLIQDMILHVVRSKNDVESRVTFKMIPFFGKVEFYEGFLKPEKP